MSGKACDMTVAQISAEIASCDKLIEQYQSNRNYWVTELGNQVVLANEVIKGQAFTDIWEVK